MRSIAVPAVGRCKRPTITGERGDATRRLVPPGTLRAGVGVSFRRKLGFIALLYVIEGFPMGIYEGFWSVVFRLEGMSLHEIGILSSLGFAWSLKVLWSPLIDRWSEERRWIAGGLFAWSVCLLFGARLDHSHISTLLFVLIAGFCAASATSDVAIDAYTIRLIEPGEEGPANSMRMGAYKIGSILGGGLLILIDPLGTPVAFLCAAALTACMAASVFLCPRVPRSTVRAEGSLEFLRRWLRKPDVGAVLAFIVLYRIGDIAMGPMVKPMWVDRGFSPAQIAVVSNVFGPIAVVLGAICGGLWVLRVGIRRSLWIVGALALLSNFGYALAAALPEAYRTPVYAASLIESFCAGLAGTGFMSYLMHICERQHAAVNYALLTAIYGVPRLFTGVASGFLTEWIGYAAYFGLTALFALPAFCFLPRASRWLETGESEAR